MATPSLRAAASVVSGGRARHRARQGRRPPGGRPSGTPRAAGRGRGAAPGSRPPATSCRRRPVDRRAYHPHRSVHGAAALGRGNLQSGVGPQAGSGASDRWCPRDEARHWAQEPGEQPRNSPLPARRQTRDARRPRRPPSRGRGQPCGVSSSCPLAEPQPPEEASFLFPRRPVSGSSPKRCPASGTSALSPDVATGRSRWRKRGRANGIRLLHRRRVSTSPVNEREPSEDHRPACKPDGRQVVSSGACH